MPKVWNLQETENVTRTEHRLPWMPKKEEWEEERNLGGMITRLWEGQETQQLYIQEFEKRILVLEGGNL
jgi:hypothetical protein